MQYGKQLDFSALAIGDLSTKQHHFVKLDSATRASVCTVQGEMHIGIVENAPIVGAAAKIVSLGFSSVQLGGTVAVMAKLTTGASGTAIEAASGEWVTSIALAGGSIGERIPVAVFQPGFAVGGPGEISNIFELPAGEDLQLFQYHFVSVVDGEVFLTIEDQAPAGILQNAPDEGDTATVLFFGQSQLKISGTLTAGTVLYPASAEGGEWQPNVGRFASATLLADSDDDVQPVIFDQQGQDFYEAPIDEDFTALVQDHSDPNLTGSEGYGVGYVSGLLDFVATTAPIVGVVTIGAPGASLSTVRMVGKTTIVADGTGTPISKGDILMCDNGVFKYATTGKWQSAIALEDTVALASIDAFVCPMGFAP